MSADTNVPERRTDPPTVVDKTEARQAVAPHELRYMLGFGLAAAIIGFVAVYVFVT